MTDRTRHSALVQALRRLVAAAVAAGGLSGGSTLGQGAAPASPPAGVVGTWAGRAVITVESGGACRYDGPETPPAVTITVRSAGAETAVSVSLKIGAPQPSACPPLDESYEATDVEATATTLRFRGPGGQEWTLGRRADALQGIVSSTERSLSGEDQLARKDASAGPPEATKKSKKGTSAVGVTAGIVTANVVGLGGLALVNKLTDDSGGSGGQASCSPRQCRFAGIADPCFCEPTITSGAKCGPTAGGVPLGGPCTVGDPCQSNLSCNTGPTGIGVCEDSIGRCPF